MEAPRTGSRGAEPLQAELRPSLRGVLHQWSVVAALVGATVLVVLAPTGGARAAVAVYGLGLVAMLGASALYHRVTWRTARARARARATDHAMIFVVIAATYTPFCALALGGTLGVVMLISVWLGAALGAAIELRWPDGPKWRSAIAYVALGWVAVGVAPALARELPPWVLLLTAAGGLLYTLGAVVYARGRPDPWPRTFGYHEVFHTLVVIAAALHFAAVTGVALG